MTGLEIAEEYFRRYGAPLIAEGFPRYENRIAAGLVGEGSECYGFDDEISRDHDWGPGFCLWLSEEECRAVGAALAEAVAGLPADFRGLGPKHVTSWGRDRVGVFEIGAFYRRFLGLDHVPTSIREWRAIPETSLAACTNGKVFVDPLGEFSRFRAGLEGFYPEDLRLKKIASRCMTLGQVGQYNFARCVRRRELVAARYTEAQFYAHAISIIFLLNRRYTPFYKWMHRAVKGLPVLGEAVHGLLAEMAASYGAEKKARLMEETCSHIIAELRRQGLSDSTSDFLPDHGPLVQERIRDPELRAIDVRQE